jgi:hypothetical protein
MRRTTDRATARARGIHATAYPVHNRTLECDDCRAAICAFFATASSQPPARTPPPRRSHALVLAGIGMFGLADCSAAEAPPKHKAKNRRIGSRRRHGRGVAVSVRRGGSSVALGGGHFAPPRLFRHRTRQLRKRRGRDSNPRSRSTRDSGFQDRRIRPLCHPSVRHRAPRSPLRARNYRRAAKKLVPRGSAADRSIVTACIVQTRLLQTTPTGEPQDARVCPAILCFPPSTSQRI